MQWLALNGRSSSALWHAATPLTRYSGEENTGFRLSMGLFNREGRPGAWSGPSTRLQAEWQRILENLLEIPPCERFAAPKLLHQRFTTSSRMSSAEDPQPLCISFCSVRLGTKANGGCHLLSWLPCPCVPTCYQPATHSGTNNSLPAERETRDQACEGNVTSGLGGWPTAPPLLFFEPGRGLVPRLCGKTLLKGHVLGPRGTIPL